MLRFQITAFGMKPLQYFGVIYKGLDLMTDKVPGHTGPFTATVFESLCIHLPG
jgi:hypothetical protein